MTWQQILDRCREIKERFDKSYKCLNIDRETGQNTINKHIKILLQCLEEIRTTFNENYERLTPSHKIAAEAFFHDTRERVIQIATKKNIDLKLPETIHEKVEIEQGYKEELELGSIENKISIMANESLNANELASITKLVTIFNGTNEELNSFIANIEILRDTFPTNKHNSFFNFIYKTKLSLKVQNRIRQIQVPICINTLISTLKEAYKPTKSPNIILNELTRIIQTDSIRKFADKIEQLTMQLNEIQISTLGEQNRGVISETNAVIAFNSFKNGLKNKEITRTIEASRVKKLNEAIEIAIEASTDMRQDQILFQTVQNRNNFGNNNRSNWNGNYSGNRNSSNDDGRNNYGNTNINNRGFNRNSGNNRNYRSNRGRPNNYNRGYFGRNNGRYNNNNNNKYNNYNNNYNHTNNNGNNNYGNNNRNNYRNNNRNIYVNQEQGNSNGPEVSRHQGSPEQNQ